MTQTSAPLNLADLRKEIDRLDEEMHNLLMQRSEIIDTLIQVKKTSESGSAFRPGREASMMRAIAERHKGLLPLDTVESIWRVIIATFTYMQAPFSVHADTSGGDAPMRDSARFHFGFTVPLHVHPSALAVIEAVAQARGDLGIFRLDQGASSGSWWRQLAAIGAPKIIARLPMIERSNHPANTPVFVISKPLTDAAVRDVILYAAQFERWRSEDAGRLERFGGEIIASAADNRGLSILLAVPGSVSIDDIREEFKRSDNAPDLVEIGSHAERFRHS